MKNTNSIKTRLTTLAIIMLMSRLLISQVSITSLPYLAGVTNFNAFNPTNLTNALATIPAGWSFASTGTAAYKGQSISGTTAGGYWSYTYFLSGDYNLGALRDAAVGNITYHVEFVNNTGGPITNLDMCWDYEQWIFANSSGFSCFGTGALAGNAILTTKGYVGSSSSFLNAATSTPLAPFTLSGLNIANGASFGISWVTNDDTGADNGIALDNFSMDASAMPSITFVNPSLSSANIYQASSNNVLYRTDVSVTPIPAQLNAAVFTTAGTYTATDLSNLKLWYSTNSVFSTSSSTLLATRTTTIGPGTKTFSGLTQTFPVGTGYLFLTTDLPCNTTINNNISVNAISTSNFTFASGTKSGSGFTGSGAQSIKAISVNAVNSQTICSGKNTPGINFVTVPAGLNVAWNNNNTATGLLVSGTGNIAASASSIVVNNQTSNITATVSNGACIGNNINFSVLVKSNNQVSTMWTGLASNDWSDSDNWTDCVCGSATDATIAAVSAPNFNPMMGISANVKNMTINAGAVLSVQNTQALNVYGNWTNNGTFNGQKGNVTFNGAVAQTIGGLSTTSFFDVTLNNTSGASLSTAQEIRGNLLLNAGIFNTNNLLTLAASATESGRIGVINANADIINNVIVQQYAHAGATGWGLFGSPITSSLTMGDWNDDFAITCLSCPNGYYNFPSIYTYNESTPGNYDNTAKYFPITNINNNITHKTGYWVYYGTGPVNTAAINVDLTGTVAKSSCLSCTGAVTIPLSFTSNNGLSNDGWNLISNPLPSPISWTALRNGNANVDNAIYVYNADLNSGRGAHASYVNGVSSDVVGGITDNIAMCQGFYVHSTAAATLTAGENIKTNTNPEFLRPSNTAKPIIRLVMNDNSGSKDMTTFYFEQGGNSSFQKEYDAYKLNFDVSFPYLGSMSDSTLTSISGLSELTSNMSIPVKAITPVSGSFTFSALQNDFPTDVCVTLYDVYTGITTNILTSDYVCSLYDTTSTSRFTMNFFTTTLSGITSSLQPNCTSPDGGMITAVGNSAGPWNYEWKNGNTIVKTVLNKTTTDTLTGLNGGNYSVKVSTTGQCDRLEMNFNINNVIPSSASFVSNVLVTALSINGQVNFTNQSTGVQTNLWDFGDGFGISGSEHPSYNYTSPGIYTVTLITESSTNCTDTSLQLIKVVDDLTGINGLNGNNNGILLSSLSQGLYELKFEFTTLKNVLVELLDMKGNTLMKQELKQIASSSQAVDLESLSNGMYLLKVSTDKNTVKTFKLLK